MKITRIGLDTAKHVFQVHGVDEYGSAVLRKQLSRSKVLWSSSPSFRRLLWAWRLVPGRTRGAGAEELWA
ncbi:MAG: hypothetical protein ACREVK_01750 [Gammaproteobacteria bacterium]